MKIILATIITALVINIGFGIAAIIMYLKVKKTKEAQHEYL